MSEATKGLTRRLAEPFGQDEIKFKPQMVKNNRALAIPYVDARVIQDRLDDVLGAECWADEYELLPDGSCVCKLSLKLGAEWISKMDVGSPSEQPDGGDRVKAAFSDALKRAAVKFGIGRYLYRLPSQWVDYDPVKRQFTRQPQLPDWARAKSAPRQAPAPATDDDEPATGALLRQAHRLIGRSRSKTWAAALAYFRFEAPAPWEEPADEEAAAGMTWLTRGAVRQILAALSPKVARPGATAPASAPAEAPGPTAHAARGNGADFATPAQCRAIWHQARDSRFKTLVALLTSIGLVLPDEFQEPLADAAADGMAGWLTAADAKRALLKLADAANAGRAPPPKG